MALNIFFDVDYTILAMDGSLRPGTREVFKRLTDDGHVIFIWSGTGIRTAEVKRHCLEEYVTDVFKKPLENFETGLRDFEITVEPDLVIDDYPQIVSAFGGILIRPYFFRASDDKEMERAYRIITDYASNGTSEDSAFRPKTNEVGGSQG